MKSSTEIRDVIAGWFDAVDKGNPAWLDRHLSSAVLVVGTDPKEWLDYQQANTLLRGEATELGGQVQIAMGRIEGWEEGSVGWGIANPTISLLNGQSFSPRWSAVFRKEDGEWKAVQIHASVGVSNEELMGSGL